MPGNLMTCQENLSSLSINVIIESTLHLALTGTLEIDVGSTYLADR